MKHGFGVEIFVNGDKYEGMYENDLPHGKGSYIWKDDSQNYNGEFKNGLRDGQGTSVKNFKNEYG